MSYSNNRKYVLRSSCMEGKITPPDSLCNSLVVRLLHSPDLSAVNNWQNSPDFYITYYEP